jgi:hypothetical protein
MRPQLAVGLETEIVQMSALTIVLPVWSRQSVCVWSFKRNAVLPQAALCFADWRAGGVLRGVIRGLRDEPGNVPACLATYGENDVFKHTAICFCRDLMFRRLARVRLALVPQHCAKSMHTKCLMRAIIPLKRTPSLVKVPSAPWTMYFVIVGITMFHADLKTAAGGYYEIDVRVRHGASHIDTLTVPHVGVGEVFVVSGQSNSTNYGEVPLGTETGMVTTFSGDAWRLANDPQPGVQDNSKKGSFIPFFGDALYRKYRVPIGVASVGHGSTSVRQWLPAGEPVAREGESRGRSCSRGETLA